MGRAGIGSFLGVALILVPTLATASSEGADASGQLASFEAVWERVGAVYPYADMGGLDWRAVHDELLPLALAAGDPAALRPVVQEMFDRLPMSHYHIVGGDSYGEIDRLIVAARPEEAGRGEIGLEARRLDGRLVVTRLEPEGAAEAAGVRPGWEVLTLGGLDGPALMEALGRTAFREGLSQRLVGRAVAVAQSARPGSPLRTRFRDGPGSINELSITVRPHDGAYAGDTSSGGRPLDIDERLLLEVGYFGFNEFVVPVPEAFGAALTRVKAASLGGVVIDLRGNRGGVAGVASGLAGFLFHRPGTSLGTAVSRAYSLTLPVFPRPSAHHYGGLVAVLQDDQSASASEVFAQALKETGRARIFGQISSGEAVLSDFEALPNGDRVQLAVADFISPGGHHIDGNGVTPDEPINLNRDSLLSEVDPVLNAAVAWIRSAQ